MLSPGAVVHGALYAQGRDITVTGRGVLTGIDYPRCHGPFFFFTTFQGCTNLVIRGVTLTEPYHWTLMLNDCEKVLVENIRICAGNMLNDDAIDPTNCRDVTIRGVFARAQDDIIAMKGMQACPRERRTPCENFLIEDCTFWTDSANVFRIGYECNAAYFANFTARNIDVDGYAVSKRSWRETWPNVVFFLQPSNGMTIRDFVFEDIRVHSDGHDNLLVLAEPRVCSCFFPNATGDPYERSYSDMYTTGGSLDGITFRNVSVDGVKGAYRGEIVVRGHSATETVRNVRFENVTRFGECVTWTSPDLLVESAGGVSFPCGKVVADKPYLLFPVENKHTEKTEKCFVDICDQTGVTLHSVILPIAADGKGSWTGTVDLRDWMGTNVVLKLLKGPAERMKFLKLSE